MINRWFRKVFLWRSWPGSRWRSLKRAGIAQNDYRSRVIYQSNEFKWKLPFYVATLILFASLLSNCVYGRVTDGEEEQSALASFLLGSARTDLQLQLRFTDGGSDAIDQFSSGGAAIDLSSLEIEIQEVEIIYDPGFFQGILTKLMYLHRDGELLAHGEETVSTTSSFRTSGGTFILTGGTATDAGGRNYQPLDLALRVPPGQIRSIRLHIGRITSAGTSDATPFGSASTELVDSSVIFNCTSNPSLNQSVSKPLLLNHSVLFAGGTSSASIRDNAASASFVTETECFTL